MTSSSSLSRIKKKDETILFYSGSLMFSKTVEKMKKCENVRDREKNVHGTKLALCLFVT